MVKTPAHLGGFLSLLDANPRLVEYCLVLELWLDRFAVRGLEADIAGSQIIRRLSRVQKLILNSAVIQLRDGDSSVQTFTRSRTGSPLDKTLSAMGAATWITDLVLAPCYDQYWTLQVLKVFSLHVVRLTLSVKEPNSILLTGFPKCPQLQYIKLPSPVLKCAAELLPAIHRSPNLRYVAIEHLKVGRSTIDERKVAIDTLRRHCLQSDVELGYDSPVSMVCVPLGTADQCYYSPRSDCRHQ
jgi:hypothetical protein